MKFFEWLRARADAADVAWLLRRDAEAVVDDLEEEVARIGSVNACLRGELAEARAEIAELRETAVAASMELTVVQAAAVRDFSLVCGSLSGAEFMEWARVNMPGPVLSKMEAEIEAARAWLVALGVDVGSPAELFAVAAGAWLVERSALSACGHVRVARGAAVQVVSQLATPFTGASS